MLLARSGLLSIRLLPVSLSHEKLWQPCEIVGGKCQGELGADALCAAQHGLGGWSDGLAPAERLLDLFADALTDAVTSMPRCASVDGAPFGLDRYMRR